MEGFSIFCLVIGMILMAVVVVAAILHVKSNRSTSDLPGFWRLEAVGFVFSLAFIFVSLMTKQNIT